MTIFALALHDTTRVHSLSEIFLLMHCINIQHPWAIPVIVTGAVTDHPRHPWHLFLPKYTRERRNGRKRTHPKVKTDANERAPTSKQTLMPCMTSTNVSQNDEHDTLGDRKHFSQTHCEAA